MKKKINFTQREPIGSSTYPMPNKEPNLGLIKLSSDTVIP